MSNNHPKAATVDRHRAARTVAKAFKILAVIDALDDNLTVDDFKAGSAEFWALAARIAGYDGLSETTIGVVIGLVQAREDHVNLAAV